MPYLAGSRRFTSLLGLPRAIARIGTMEHKVEELLGPDIVLSQGVTSGSQGFKVLTVVAEVHRRLLADYTEAADHIAVVFLGCACYVSTSHPYPCRYREADRGNADVGGYRRYHAEQNRTA